jgi:hypothetical protein
LSVIVNFKLRRKEKMKVAENPTKELKKTNQRRREGGACPPNFLKKKKKKNTKRKRSALHYGREMKDARGL